MNFDELRDAWTEESVQPPALPPFPTEKTGSAIAAIRKNMRQEFIWTLIGYAGALVYILLFARTRYSLLIICCATFLIVQTLYYFGRFFIFYKRSSGYDLSLKKNLRRFAYEMQLNMEIYKTYSFCVAPMACLLWISIMDAAGWTGILRLFACSETAVSMRTVWFIVLNLAIGQLIVAFILRLHVRTQYGRFVALLKRTLEDWDED